MKGGRFDTLKSDSTHHFFRNACTKPGSLRFSQFSGCWLILSVYILMSFDFPFVRLFEFGNFVITLIHWVSTNKQKMQWKSIPGADPGFVVRGGGVSRRGVWGPLKVPSGSKAERWQGTRGEKPPGSSGVWGITDIYLNDNFEPTTPFLSDQKNLILSLNFVG